MYKTFIVIYLVSYVSVIISGVIFIPFLKKIKAGQNILEYVKEHSFKSGTPTMGGLFFIVPFIIISLAFFKGNKTLACFTLIITFAYMVVGFLDDLLKVKNKRNLGLKAYQKIIFQFSIAIVCAFFCYKTGLTKIYIPFTKNCIDIKFWCVPLIVIVFLATTNAVNLTDGLDGLASSCSIMYLLFMLVLCVLQVNKVEYFLKFSEYLNIFYCIVVFIGCLCSFLFFNTFKAKVFMGDTGSLALGGFISCISIFTGNSLYILLIGFVFVISGLSVILQVGYFKISKGKRIFLMAPYHHHLQHKGLDESKIVYVYTTITIVFGLISIFNYV